MDDRAGPPAPALATRPALRVPMRAAVCLLLFGCGADAAPEQPGTIVHPVEDSLASSVASVPVHSASLSGDPGPTAASLATFDSTAAVGERDGAEDEVLGELMDAVLLADGRVAVLDPQYGALRIFSPDLGALARLGRAGEGPGEFVEPVAALTDGEGRMGVLDTAAGRIVWFDPSSEGDAEPSSQTIPFARSFDACSIDGRVFALGVRFGENGASSETASTALVHEVDADGALVRSFSEPYAYLRYPLVADIFGMGRMACDEARGGRIWAAYSALGEVHGLTADGELHWITRLPDLGFPRQAHVPWTRIGSDPDQEVLRVEHINAIALVSPSLLAVQVHSRSRASSESSDWAPSHRTYLLDPQTGETLGGFEADHQVLGGADGRAVLYQTDPHPRLSVVEAGR